jgi:hypothetical protein
MIIMPVSRLGHALHAHRSGRGAQQGFTLAESARLMPVTHRPLLARAPKTGLSPESRWPQGLETLVSWLAQSGCIIVPAGQWSPHFLF